MASTSLTSVRNAAHHPQIGIAAVLVATVFWSFGGVLAKATDAHGVVVTFWRMWMASVLLAVICRSRHEWPTWREFVRSALAGVLFGMNICVFFTALERMTVASALVIAALAPVMMLPIAVKMLGERITPMKLLCAVIAVAGVVVSVLATPKSSEEHADTLAGSLLALLALVLWVGYLVVSKRVRATVSTFPFMLSATVIGGLSVSATAAIGRADVLDLKAIGWVWILILAVGPGITGHGLVAWAQSRVDASVSTVLMQAEPVGASIAAYFLLDENVGAVQMLSMGVVIVALCLLVYSESRETAELEADAMA